MLVVCVLVPQIGIACECRRHQHLYGCPLVLERNNTVTVASPEAATLAIKPGDTITGARSRLVELVVLPYDEPYYRTAAEVIWQALAVESSVVEPMSAERAFTLLDGTDIPERTTDLTLAIAQSATTRVQTGLGSSKLVAFQAALRSEPTIIYSVEAREELDFLASLSVGSIEQIDPDTRKRLKNLGVHTLGDLQKVPLSDLVRQFRKQAFYLSRLAIGEDGDPVKATWPPPDVSRSFRFESLEVTEEQIDERLLIHALRFCTGQVADILQERRTRCKHLALTLLLSDGEVLHEDEELEHATSHHAPLLSCAERLLRRSLCTVPPSEITLSASALGSGTGVQLGLLDEHGRTYEQKRRLWNAVQTAERQFGLGAVAQGIVPLPRQSMLFTAPLTHRKSEPVEVELDAREHPVRVARVRGKGQIWDMQVRVIDWWRETSWCEDLRESTVYRVEREVKDDTEEGGFFDLVHVAFDDWRLMAVAD